MTTPNVEIRVIGTEAIERRIRNVERLSTGAAPALRRAIGTLVRELARRIPVRTGRLYRSLRIVNLPNNRIRIFFTAPYAIYANYRSKRNARYIERGVRAGVRQANALGGPVLIRLRRLTMVQRYGREGRAEIYLSYTLRSA